MHVGPLAYDLSILKLELLTKEAVLSSNFLNFATEPFLVTARIYAPMLDCFVFDMYEQDLAKGLARREDSHFRYYANMMNNVGLKPGALIWRVPILVLQRMGDNSPEAYFLDILQVRRRGSVILLEDLPHQRLWLSINEIWHWETMSDNPMHMHTAWRTPRKRAPP